MTVRLIHREDGAYDAYNWDAASPTHLFTYASADDVFKSLGEIPCVKLSFVDAGPPPCSDTTIPLENMRYKRYYEALYDKIKKAIGTERFAEAEREALSSNNYGLTTMLLAAIEKLREDAGDFDHDDYYTGGLTYG